MGYEAELRIVPVGEPRRKVVAEATARAVENNHGLNQRLADIRSQPEPVTPKADIP